MKKSNKVLNYFGGVVVMIVSVLMYISLEPQVEGIGLIVLTVITLVPFVIGGGMIWVAYKVCKDEYKSHRET